MIIVLQVSYIITQSMMVVSTHLSKLSQTTLFQSSLFTATKIFYNKTSLSQISSYAQSYQYFPFFNNYYFSSIPMNEIVVKVIENYSYQTNHALGEGVYGKVYLGADRTTGDKVAIKKIETVIFTQDKYLEGAIYSEIRLLKRFSHPNIIKFIDVLNSKHNLYIVTEFCKDGDLKQLIKKRKRIPEEEAFGIIAQILNGFTQLVDEKIIHRDLKPANILVNNGVYKIADFGFARYVDNFGTQMLKSLVGSPIYMAPQILERNDYTTKCDIWSIGVIFFEMVFGRHPWTGRDENDLLRAIQNIPITSLIRRESISAKAADFLKKCLAYSEGGRVGWNELFETYLYKGEKEREKEKEVPKPLEFQPDKYSVGQGYKNASKIGGQVPASKSSSFSNSNNSNTTTSSNNPQSPNNYQTTKDTNSNQNNQNNQTNLINQNNQITQINHTNHTTQNATSNNTSQPSNYLPGSLGSLGSLNSKETTTNNHTGQNAPKTYGGYNSYTSLNQHSGQNNSYSNLNNKSPQTYSNNTSNINSNQVSQPSQSYQPSQTIQNNIANQSNPTTQQTSPSTYIYSSPTSPPSYTTLSPTTQPTQTTSNIRIPTTIVHPQSQTSTPAKSQSYGLSIEILKAGRQVVVAKFQLLEKLLKIGRADCLDVYSWEKLLFVLAQFSKVKSIYLSSLLNILIRTNKNLDEYAKATQKEQKQYEDAEKHIIQSSTCISRIKEEINMIGFKSEIINEDRIRKLEKTSCQIATEFVKTLMEDLKKKQNEQAVQLLEVMIQVIESESEVKSQTKSEIKSSGGSSVQEKAGEQKQSGVVKTDRLYY